MKTKIFTLFVLLFVGLTAAAQDFCGTWKTQVDENTTVAFTFNINNTGTFEFKVAAMIDLEETSNAKLDFELASSVPLKWTLAANNVNMEIAGAPVSSLNYDLIGIPKAEEPIFKAIMKPSMDKLKEEFADSILTFFTNSQLSVTIVSVTPDKLKLDTKGEIAEFTKVDNGTTAASLITFSEPSNKGIAIEDLDAGVHSYKEDPKVYNIVEQDPMFPGGEAALLKYIATHVKYPMLAQEYGAECIVVLKFVILEDGSVGEVQIENIKPLSKPSIASKEEYLKANAGATAADYNTHVQSEKAWFEKALNKCADESTRVVKTLPRFIPGKQKGQPVKVWFTLPVRFQLQ